MNHECFVNKKIKNKIKYFLHTYRQNLIESTAQRFICRPLFTCNVCKSSMCAAYESFVVQNYIFRNSRCTVSMVTIRVSIDFMLIKCVNLFIKIQRKKKLQWQMAERKFVIIVGLKECIYTVARYSFCG